MEQSTSQGLSIGMRNCLDPELQIHVFSQLVLSVFFLPPPPIICHSLSLLVIEARLEIVRESDHPNCGSLGEGMLKEMAVQCLVY